MKKIIAIIAIILGFGLGVNAQSQSDGFFNNRSILDYNNESNTELPRIPNHNLNTNQNAPLGSGLLILVGLGLGYGVRRKLKVEN